MGTSAEGLVGAVEDVGGLGMEGFAGPSGRDDVGDGFGLTRVDAQ